MKSKFFVMLLATLALVMLSRCEKNEPKNPSTPAGVKMVDLGLPSGLKWANMNIGAAAPEEYGNYYAWGEVTTKSDYSWSTYLWCNGSSSSMTKYCTSSSYGTVDNKATLESADDAAHVNWGGNWRMPTDDEWAELLTQCSWTWTTQNGVDGYRVTANNGNSIFLPAAGYRDGTYLEYDGSVGLYWSLSLDTGSSIYAYSVGFDSSEVDRGDGDRIIGHSVRPVARK